MKNFKKLFAFARISQSSMNGRGEYHAEALAKADLLRRNEASTKILKLLRASFLVTTLLTLSNANFVAAMDLDESSPLIQNNDSSSSSIETIPAQTNKLLEKLSKNWDFFYKKLNFSEFQFQSARHCKRVPP